MNRSACLATYIFVAGSLMPGAMALGQQPSYRGNAAAEKIQSSPRDGRNPIGAAPLTGAQVQDDGWQRGEEPLRDNQQRPATNQPTNVQPPNAAGAQPPPRAPFVLTPQEEADLNQILIAWERTSSTIKTYKCEFWRFEYGLGFGADPADKQKPRTESTGELKYSAPDKGMFKVNSIKILDVKKRQYVAGTAEDLEHWVCDGQSVFEIDHKKKTRTQRPLPPEMRGTAISDGPLPFVFGAKAAKLKERYWMRDITPPGVTDAIWLEAHPRYQADAANFKHVEIIIGRRDFMPQAIKMYSPAFDPKRGNDSSTVFTFQKMSYNGRFDNVFSDFVEPDVPFHYKKIVLQPMVQEPSASSNQAPPSDQRSARLPGRTATR